MRDAELARDELELAGVGRLQAGRRGVGHEPQEQAGERDFAEAARHGITPAVRRPGESTLPASAAAVTASPGPVALESADQRLHERVGGAAI